MYIFLMLVNEKDENRKCRFCREEPQRHKTTAALEHLGSKVDGFYGSYELDYQSIFCCQEPRNIQRTEKQAAIQNHMPPLSNSKDSMLLKGTVHPKQQVFLPIVVFGGSFALNFLKGFSYCSVPQCRLIFVTWRES